MRRPAIIAHRGASGHRPEHTLAAYRLGALLGADYIEPDLVATRDGHLVSRHENELSGSTDIAARPEFAARRTTKTVDGREATGWFSEDLTLAEIRTLRAVERIPGLRPGNALLDGVETVPTFGEICDLAEEMSAHLGRTVHVMPEIKHPGYFAAIGLDLVDRVAAAIEARGWNRPDAPVAVQSFEPDSLRRLDARTAVPLVQLIGSRHPELATPEGLDEVAGYAEIIGPDLGLVLPIESDGVPGEPTPLVAEAHARGLLVTPYTLRSENAHLPAAFRNGAEPAVLGDFLGFYQAVLATGIDGAFADQPDHLYAARARMAAC
ncbi:glycerophosphodiester phosphodiesterase family protein [Allonocardiopsis opalescens]|uniref:glycerophosphodiester phosphodiesterase n=1 Tax=Allonocardiopsis opalescens TaxID=1144618 RepID=A0A2T0QCK2_9ACTN|nr:glycerophosphodiester phosphodiesterase family protein [Allonocardiopsis opalescens]PRY01676.1 glycerophosphoryl diester phosphodiesterase [Allonocardiopsis opalescens]